MAFLLQCGRKQRKVKLPLEGGCTHGIKGGQHIHAKIKRDDAVHRVVPLSHGVARHAICPCAIVLPLARALVSWLAAMETPVLRRKRA